MSVTQQKAVDFLSNAQYFDLGHIVTEQPHPKTLHLSSLVNDKLPDAIQLLQQVDLDALEQFSHHLPQLVELQQSIEKTLSQGGKIYLCGCGATGRLALFLESLWRSLYNTDQIHAFMAGGDVALVHSIEDFEDFPEFGARHLQQMGFSPNDLLISCTEGGETPYVIGATEHASKIALAKPYFIYCNPDSCLKSITRSLAVLENDQIRKINLFVGPMAIAGSTRMQASTVLQLAVGLALFFKDKEIANTFNLFRDLFQQANTGILQALIEKEAEIYQDKNYVHYMVRDYGITVFTDTTERAPTFSLAAFDNLQTNKDQYSLSYISLAGAQDKQAAWHQLLGRQPNYLNWPDINRKTMKNYLESFDFSVHALRKRQDLIADHKHINFYIHKANKGICLQLAGIKHHIQFQPLHPLIEHMMLKLFLNIHSTLVMGKLKRYTHNLMTYVSPTNGKLIDRAARYVKIILEQNLGKEIAYSKIIEEIFRQKEKLAPNESIVLKTCAALSGSSVKLNAL